MIRLRDNPTTQISLALALMAGVLVLVAGLLLDRPVDGRAERAQARRLVAESIAVQAATLAGDGDLPTLRKVLHDVAARDRTIASIAMRRADGSLHVRVGEPPAGVPGPAADAAAGPALRVALMDGTTAWGHLEILHRPDADASIGRWLGAPMLAPAAFVFVVGLLGFWLFMRRVLLHLDPGAVIPERVRSAFDALSEGVAIVDLEGRVVLANEALRRQVGYAAVRDGARLDALRWRATVVAGGESREIRTPELPWTRAMRDRKPVLGVPMQLEVAESERELQVSCSPVRDGHAAVRGCLVSVADQTAVVRANAGLRSAVAELRASREEIERKNRALERLAMVDPLTECLNRRAFARAAGPLFARAARGHEPLSVLVADIDRFKSINDRFGHAVGDEVIRALGATLTGLARPGDLAARWGGEEFVLLLPDCDADAAESAAERIRAAVASRCSDALGARHAGLRFTVSIGVASVGPSTATLEALIEHGDVALYHAKRSGRDRVARHDRLPATGPADRDAPSPLSA